MWDVFISHAWEDKEDITRPLAEALRRKGLWPQKELDGLTAREVGSGKVILPIWHDVTWEDGRRFSPTLADKLAVLTAKGLDTVVEEIVRALQQAVSTVVVGGRFPAGVSGWLGNKHCGDLCQRSGGDPPGSCGGIVVHILVCVIGLILVNMRK